MKLDGGPEVIVRGKPQAPYIKGMRIALKELIIGHNTTYHIVEIQKLDSDRGVLPVSNLDHECQHNNVTSFR